MNKEKNEMENPEVLKEKETPQINHVDKPNEEVPTLNEDNDPPVNWHPESGEKINEYGKS
ncbi:MAG: hypothetical protein LUH22_12385 [Bacteroides sp.]|nr:hypothetical protein [Bacteroides sp.]